jgi:hypothetical protein
MIGKWLSKLYRRFNDTNHNIDVHAELNETRYSMGRYKNASEEFKKTVSDNHFAQYLIYDKGEHKHD